MIFWRDFLQLKAHLLGCCVLLRFVASISRSQKTFSSPESRDVLRFIAPCSGFIQGGSAWCESAASAFLQEGPKGDLHWDCSGFASVLTQILKKKDQTSEKKLGRRGGLALLCVHTVCHPYSMPQCSHFPSPQDHEWLLEEQTPLVCSQSMNWH